MKPLHTLQRVRKYRRKRVKRIGKRVLRNLNGYFGRHSLVGDPAVFDRGVFPFTRQLESRWQFIRDECRQVLDGETQLPPVQSISRDSRRVGTGGRWRVFMFYGFGYRSPRNCLMCPETAAALAAIPNMQSAWFSVLEPGGQIPIHRGVTKGMVRCHLGLIVPRERERCYMAIDDREVHWQEGRCELFDDMCEHWVHNDTDEARVVLLVDVLRPLRAGAAVLNRALLAVARRTAYVQEARRKHIAWEAEYHASL